MSTNPVSIAAAEVSRLLTTGGERLSARALLPLLYGELRRLAAARLSKERSWVTITPTVLVHEAYLRLLGDGTGKSLAWNDKAHFFGAAALAMRRILVERARRRRGRPVNVVSLGAVAEPPLDGGWVQGMDLVDLDSALTELEQVHPRPYQVVMARFFGGLGVDDIAAMVDISVPTVGRDWSFARAWLLERITRGS